VQLTAFVAAWHTCLSRVSDFKHHYSDVIGGAFLGTTVAVFITCIVGKKIWDKWDKEACSLQHTQQANAMEAPPREEEEEQRDHEAYDMS